jgi:hypothetical protein
LQAFRIFGRRRKAQFFILAAFAMVTMFYLISKWIEPFTIIDTSQVPLMDEMFIFNNIKEKTYNVINNSASCTDLNYNFQEYKDYVTSYALSKGYSLKYDYLLTPCLTNFTLPVYFVTINMTLQSPRTRLSSLFSYQWPPNP